MSVYDNIAPEDLLRIEQENKQVERLDEIELVTADLRRALSQVKDLRLGQLMLCALGCDPENLHQKLWYIEDHDLAEQVVSYARSLSRKQNHSR